MLSPYLVFPKTSVWRFTLIFSSVMLTLAVAILVIVYQFTLGDRKDELQQRILFNAKSFKELAETQGVSSDDFFAALELRANRTTSQVLFLEYKGRVIGNLKHMPAIVPNFPNLSSFPIAVTSDQADLQVVPVLATVISTVYGNLLVGSFDTYADIQERFLFVSVLVILAALIVSLLAGFLFNRSVLGRVTKIAGQLEGIKQGHLESRLSVSSKGDEYDMISGEVNKMLDTIDELLQSVSTVTDNIAHDLRTPLSRMRIKLDANLSSLDESDPQRLFGEGLIHEVDHLIETFNSMLELSRLEKGVSQSDLKACSLETICRDVVELISPAAEDKVTLSTHFENPETIQSDSNLLFRAIYNVVDNAVNYSDDGGEVRLSVSHCRIVIEDNGPGIPEDERERVFQRLYRLDKSRNSEGFGMGLAIVKAIVTRLGGQIKLEAAEPGLRVVIDF